MNKIIFFLVEFSFTGEAQFEKNVFLSFRTKSMRVTEEPRLRTFEIKFFCL